MTEQELNEVILYGSEWCPYTWRAKKWLGEWHVTYRYVDVDARPDELRQIADWNGGRAIRPTFDVGGEILVNPKEDLLCKTLRSHGIPNS
jgi:glutaredoxin